MGHSTVGFSKKGKLTQSEISAAARSKQSDDRSEYGYNESPDSYAHADSPSSKHLDKVYSQSKANEIKYNLERYESIAYYFVPDETWNKAFPINKKEENKLKKMIEKVSKNLTKLKDKKPKVNAIVSCKKCKSKINASMALYKETSYCPVCRDSNENTFGKVWSEKLYGKVHLKKVAKLQEELEGLRKKLMDLRQSRTSEISVYDLDKYPALKKDIYTGFAADIHH